MKIVLIALLYSTPASEPFVKVADYVYSDMQSCYQDSDYAKAVLMEGAPYPESYVDTFCVILPSEA